MAERERAQAPKSQARFLQTLIQCSTNQFNDSGIRIPNPQSHPVWEIPQIKNGVVGARATDGGLHDGGQPRHRGVVSLSKGADGEIEGGGAGALR